MDHPETFLLKALFCQWASSWLKVRGTGLVLGFPSPHPHPQSQSQSLDKNMCQPGDVSSAHKNLKIWNAVPGVPLGIGT